MIRIMCGLAVRMWVGPQALVEPLAIPMRVFRS